MRVLMRNLEAGELLSALKRHQTNAPKCSFELSEDGLKVKKKGLKVLKKPQKKVAAEATT